MGDPSPPRLTTPIRALVAISMVLGWAAVTAPSPALATPPPTKLAGGGFHTCGITSLGGLECWGQNSDGQLGDGTNTVRLTPVHVVGLSSGVFTVATGLAHTCAVASGGKVECWGLDADGELGDGTNESSAIPVRVSGLSGGIVAVVAGSAHTCALKSSGDVLCWGANSNGQLGDGTTQSRNTPVRVTGLPPAVVIAAGGFHTCAVTAAGAVMCWGSNASGQLGDGTTVQRNVPVKVAGLGSGMASVTAGGSHTCASTQGGGAKCWGDNTFGQLGDGTMVQRLTPVDVVGLASGIATLSAGGDHTCALLAGGGLQCWGANRHGELGNGSTTPRTTLSNVYGLGSGVTSIASGQFHTCAMSGSSINCWGDNTAGQLGTGSLIQRLVPVDVFGLSAGVVRVTTGGYHTCVVTTKAALKCWGDNTYGQLGIGNTQEQNVPVMVPSLFSNVSMVSAGEYHTCALTTAGGVKCWGSNSAGQLGDGTTTDRTTPVDVVGLTSGVTAIAAGHHHTCALVRSGVQCWGDNAYGQLGDGTTTESDTPVRVVGLGSPVIGITGGGDHACALTVSNGIKCWGANGFGQLGDGTTVQRTTPVDVVGLTSGVVQVSAGGLSTCARTNVGAMKCWGDNEDGQLGDGTTVQESAPVGVTGLQSSVQWVTVGGLHACAVTSVGGAMCWGRNTSGEVGNGSATDQLLPVAVTGLTSGVRVVSGGISHTCAITTSGGLKCWGRNDSGQTGDGTSTFAVFPLAVVGF